MNKRLAAATLVAAVATTAGLFARPSTSAPGSCNKPHACSVSLTATGPSPSTLTAPATSNLSFDNTDSAPHTVVFANGLCSITLNPGEQGGPGSVEAGVPHPDCNDNFSFFVGNYPYTVDGKFAATVTTTPLRRVVTLTARTHAIRHGTRLTLHGQVSWFDYNPNTFLMREQFRVVVLARQDSRHAFKPITTGRVWSSQVYGPSGLGIGYAWKRKVKPGAKTTYIAKVTAQPWIWSSAQSRPFTVRIRK
jgi:hypothetical protein